MKILVVDDDKGTLLLFEKFLGKLKGATVILAAGGEEALQQARFEQPDLILLDQNMPGMDGFTVLKKMRAIADLQNTPVIMVTAQSDRVFIDRAIKAGANDYLLKPFQKKALMERVEKCLHVEAQWQSLPPQQKGALQLTLTAVDQALGSVKKEQALVYADVRTASQAILRVVQDREGARSLLRAVKDHNHPTFAHSLRMAVYFFLLTEAQGLTAEDRLTVVEGALVHDAGVARIDSRILQKTESLNLAEWETLKKHVDYTVELLQRTPGITNTVIEIGKFHHEKLDGSGFPAGLRGMQIGMLGRMASLVDTYTTVTDQCPYGPTFPAKEALKMLHWPPGQFDPDLLVKFTNLINSLKRESL